MIRSHHNKFSMFSSGIHYNLNDLKIRAILSDKNDNFAVGFEINVVKLAVIFKSEHIYLLINSVI